MKLKTVGLILLVSGIVGASIGVVFSVFSTGYLTVEVLNEDGQEVERF